MSLENAKRQKTKQLELSLGGKGEAPMPRRSVEALTAAHGNERSRNDGLMERVVEEGNVKAAVRRVRQNKGSPGMDGMSVEELPRHLEGNWEGIRAELLAGKPLQGTAPIRALPEEAEGRLGKAVEVVPCLRLAAFAPHIH